MSITLKINTLRGEIAPLYSRYAGQTSAQDAYVEMDEDGIVRADYSGEIGGGIPFSVYHGRIIRWGVSNTVRGDVLADYLESDETIALLERVEAGQSIEWDGNNNRGKLDDDATEARDTIGNELDAMSEDDRSCGAVWDLDNWLGQLHFDDKWPVGKTLADAVKGIEDGAEAEGIQLDGNIEKYLLDYAQNANERGECYRPEVLVALVEDGRHPEDEEGEEWVSGV